MQYLNDYSDVRLINGCCVHCGSPSANTRDHSPSRVFLDRPYPENLPVVLACEACNLSFSSDEQYLACLIECVKAGEVASKKIERPKIRRIISDTPGLARRLEDARRTDLLPFDGAPLTKFMIEPDRVRNVIVKLARCHAVFECSEPMRHSPAAVAWAPLETLGNEAHQEFDCVPVLSGWPEVGTRALQRLACGVDTDGAGWVEVQPDRYRYAVIYGEPFVVRLVISEYLAAEVAWEQTW
jgi:hypothetical protein